MKNSYNHLIFALLLGFSTEGFATDAGTSTTAPPPATDGGASVHTPVDADAGSAAPAVTTDAGSAAPAVTTDAGSAAPIMTIDAGTVPPVTNTTPPDGGSTTTPTDSTPADAGPMVQPGVGEACDPDTFQMLCEGTTWTRCNDNVVEQLDCNGDDYWNDPSFGPDWTCGVRGCLSETEGFCEERAEQPRCVPSKDGGYCRGYLTIVDPEASSLYVCEEGGSCVVGAEDDGSGLRLRERCRPSLGSCDIGQTNSTCQGDVATFCRELVSNDTSFAVPDVMGYDCSVQGWTCADGANGSSACVTGGGEDETCMTGYDFLVACGENGQVSTTSACNVLSTMAAPIGSEASNGTCVTNDDITACDPNAFTDTCMGDFLALSCLPVGQPKGYDCTAPNLAGTCVTSGPAIGGEAFCEVAAGKPCNGGTVRCAEGSSCSLSGTCIVDFPEGEEEAEEEEEEEEEELQEEEASEGCGCSQTQSTQNTSWLGLLFLIPLLSVRKRKNQS